MRRLHILHRTYYNFAEPVLLNAHRLMLRPREGHDVQIESAKLDITPTAQLRWTRDEYDNSLAIAVFDERAQQLAIVSEVVIRHDDPSPLAFVVDAAAVQYPFALEAATRVALQPFLTPPEDRVAANVLRHWLGEFWKAGERIETYGLLWRLCTGINRTFKYQIREEPGVQSAADTVARKSGSCRDFARLLMEAARVLGLPARFVSGYLHAPNSGWDLGATHAWTEIYLPGAGWKGFDATIGELASSKHIPVAIGRVADAVPPIAGSFVGPPGGKMSVGVWVTELSAVSDIGSRLKLL